MVLPLGDLQKTRILPITTYGLIAANVVMYLVQLDRGQDFTIDLAATPIDFSEGPEPGKPVSPWLTLLTSMFLHGSPLHLSGNMLYLWIFGDNVEEVLGRFRYLLGYLACGVVGTIAQILADPTSTVPTLGASGAIAGIMGAYLVWFPHNQVRVLVFRFITVMPAALVIGLWIVIQLWLGFGGAGRIGPGGGVAYLAHIGGASTGLFIAWLFHDRALAVQSQYDANDGWFIGP